MFKTFLHDRKPKKENQKSQLGERNTRNAQKKDLIIQYESSADQ